jgi:hypothetical protein
MEPGAVAGGRPPETDAPGQGVEGGPDRGPGQPGAPRGHKKGGGGPAGEEPIPPRRIRGEHVLGRGVNRHQARLAELRAANGEQPGREVHIGGVQVERLADAQAGDGQQAQEPVVREPPQPVRGREVLRGLEQAPDLLVTVHVRARPARAVREPTPRGHFGVRVLGAPVAGEPSDKPEPPSPFHRAGRRRVLGPLKGQREGEVGGAVRLEKRGEAREGDPRGPELEPQAAAQLEIVLDALSPGGHRTPPGHGRARAARAARSTLA